MTVKKRLTRAIAGVLIILFVITPGSIITAEDTTNSTELSGTQLNSADNAASQPNEAVVKGGDKSVVREVKEKRTKNTKHYLLADGSYQAVISMGDVHYEDENGEFQDIKTDLIDEADIDLVDVPFSKESSVDAKLIKNNNKEKRKNNQIDKNQTDFRALQVPFDVKIPKKFSNGYSIGKGSDKLSFKPVGSSTARALVNPDKKNQVTYANVWNQTDVMLDVTDQGVKETMILKTSAAPTTFSFEVEGPLADDLTAGELGIQPAWLRDAEGTERDVSQNVRRQNGKVYVDLVVNVSGLAYPIEVDPTTSISRSAMFSCYKYSTAPAYPPITGPIGWTDSIDTRRLLDQGYNETAIAILSFDTSPLPDASVVSSANLKFTPQYLWNFNSKDFEGEFGSFTMSTSDYTDNSAGSAFSTAISSLVINVENTININNSVLTSINKTGTTYLRMSISTGIPTGRNGVRFGYLQAASLTTLNITYNQAPTAPVVTYPNGGETLSASHTISWTAATDADTPQASLQYQIQMSTDGGYLWTDIVALTTAGAITYAYDFSSVAPSTTSLVRIRAYDGAAYGSWDQSDVVFIIHQSPNAPTNLSPGSSTSGSPIITAGTSPILNWTFTDPDVGDAQSQFEVVVYNTNTSTLVHDSGWINSSSNSYTVPSALLNRNTPYNWQVKVKDNKGLASAYSSLKYIKINNLPVATMTSYTDGQQINTNILNFNWTYSDTDAQTQSSFQVVGSKDNWATLVYNSGEIVSSATSLTTPGLADGEWDFKVRVKDGFEWSDWNYRSNVTLPNSFEPNDTSGTAFPASYNTLFTSIIQSATDIDFYSYTPSSSGIDQINLTVPAGKNYEVYVYNSTMNLVALSGNGTGVNEKIIYDVTGGQTYFIKIAGMNGDFSASANYAFQLLKHTVNYQTTYQYDSNGNLISKTTTIVQP